MPDVTTDMIKYIYICTNSQQFQTGKKMREHSSFIIFFILPLLFAVVSLHGQTAIQASTTADVRAKVLTAVKTSQINFGHYYSGSYNGQLKNNPDGILFVEGSVNEGGDIHYSTSFDVSGNGNTAFAISFPNSPITLTNNSVSKTITVGNWKTESIPTLGVDELPAAYKTVNLDATLKLGTSEDNPIGLYLGYYTITFGFN